MLFVDDEQGRVGFRGRYMGEIPVSDYPTVVTGLSVSGLKSKDLLSVAESFPSVRKLTIEKTSQLKSLKGIEKFNQLLELRIEGCANISDFSSLGLLQNLHYLDLEKTESAGTVISYLLDLPLTDLYINDSFTDFEEISKLGSLSHLTINGNGSNRQNLPLIPSVSVSFGLEGFNDLKSAKCLANLKNETRIRWWGPKPIDDIPTHLQDNAAFK